MSLFQAWMYLIGIDVLMSTCSPSQYWEQFTKIDLSVNRQPVCKPTTVGSLYLAFGLIAALFLGLSDARAERVCSIQTSPKANVKIAKYKFSRICPSFAVGGCNEIGNGVWQCSSSTVIGHSSPRSVEQPTRLQVARDSVAAVPSVTVIGSYIIMPDDGWYLIQRATDYAKVDEGFGGRMRYVSDGTYNVINLTTNTRHDNVVVSTARTLDFESASASRAASAVPTSPARPAPGNIPRRVTVPRDDRNRVVVGSNPGEAQCLKLGTKAKGFGSISDDDLRKWIPGYRFSTGEQFLSVEIDESGKSMLRHKYVPSRLGTDRVVIGANLPRYRTYRVTETVFLEPGWEWGGDKYEGGKLGFGFGGGSAPSGGIVDRAGFTARIMWRGNYLGGGEYDGTGRLVVYSYAADRSGRLGEDIPISNFVVPIGKWVQITYEVQANSTITTADGHVRAWIDGELMLDVRGKRWQSAGGKPVIDTLYYSSFYGGGSRDWSPSKSTYAKVKDVCWAAVVDGYSGINPDNGLLYVD